jgi:RimJ/RimL family protein N-acetyltransferase
MPLGPVPHQLETARLVLAPSRAEDAEIYRRLWSERDPRVPPHRRIDVAGHPTLDEIAAQIRDGAHAGLLRVERTPEGDVIGYCGLVFHGNGSPDDPELAYELLRDAQGHGYATEAAAAVVEWARQAGHRRLWATVRAWNAPSLRVLEKLGFRDTGRTEADPRHGDSLLLVLDL